MIAEPLLLKSADVCRMLSISRMGLWRLEVRGLIKPIHLDPNSRKGKRYDAEAIRAFVAKLK